MPRKYYGSIAEYCNFLGGTKIIERVLVANNGIAAVKCIRSIRHWAYDLFRDERIVKFICMATPEDYQANAEYIRAADQVISVPGGANNNNYANVELIVELAKQYNIDAVWAGWGHASENPRLPKLLEASNITFLGPRDKAMHALGDKIASCIIAQTADVPTMPWNGDSLKLHVKNFKKKLEVPPEMYEKARIKSVQEGLTHAERIGFPVMIKASAGGGGKGIRMCSSSEDFDRLFTQVSQEVPGSPIFIMKLATGARHLEVQLLADDHGNCVSLFGRDCSIQRRHQKIIEEAPQTVAPDDIFHKMEQDAVNLAKLVGYRSTGTVEYLYLPDDQKYYFLELNPRLQVEHPCTELISDTNLPACQLLVGMGIKLENIPCIRRLYSKNADQIDPYEQDLSKLDFDQANYQPVPKGHVIAARITSENPDRSFQPDNGKIDYLTFRSATNVWGYFSVTSQGRVHEFADSQFGHLFSNKKDRQNAISHLVIALGELCVQADFRTTTEYLIELLEHPEFQNNNFHTAWLDNLLAAKEQTISEDRPVPLNNVISAACVIADKCFQRSKADYIFALQRGQVLPADAVKTSTDVDLVHRNKKFRFHVAKIDDHSLNITNVLNQNKSSIEVEVHQLSDGGLLCNFYNTNNTVYLREEADSFRVTVNNKVTIFTKETDPSILKSPTAGKLVRYLIPDGQKIKVNQVYAEIEVMKMNMTLQSAAAGTFHQDAAVGGAIVGGAILGHLTEMDLDSQSVKELEDYTGEFSDDLDTLSLGPAMSSSMISNCSEKASQNDLAEKQKAEEKTRRRASLQFLLGRNKNKTEENHNNQASRRPKQIQSDESLKLGQVPENSSSSSPKNITASLSTSALNTTTVGSDDGSPLKTEKPHKILKSAEAKVLACLNGFCYPPSQFEEQMQKAIDNILESTKDRSLPLYELKTILDMNANQIPKKVQQSIANEARIYKGKMKALYRANFPSNQIKNCLHRYAAQTPEGIDRTAFLRSTENITKLCDQYTKGSKGRLVGLITSILQEYQRVEQRFAYPESWLSDNSANENSSTGGGYFEMSMERMLDDIKGWPEDRKKNFFEKLVDDVVAYNKSDNRAQVMALLIQLIRKSVGSDLIKDSKELRSTLEKLTELTLTKDHRRVALEARKALMESYQKSYEERKNWLENRFIKFIQSGGLSMDIGDEDESLDEIILSETAIFDVIPEFFFHDNIGVRTAALEVYVQRSYLAYDVSELEPFEIDGSDVALRFVFTLPRSHYGWGFWNYL